MKKLVLIIYGCLLIAAIAQAQTIDVKINPIGLIFNSPDLSGEYIINENIGVELTIGLEYGNGTLGLLDLDRSGYKVRAMGRYYFRPENGGDRFYAGLYLGPKSRSFTYNDTDNLLGYDPGYKISGFTAGLGLGFKWVSQKGIMFEIGTGFGRSFGQKITYNDADNPSTADGLGLDFISTLAVGYRIGN